MSTFFPRQAPLFFHGVPMSCIIIRPTEDPLLGAGERRRSQWRIQMVEIRVEMEVEIVVLTRNKTNNNFAIMHLLLSPSPSCRDLVLPIAFIIKISLLLLLPALLISIHFAI